MDVKELVRQLDKRRKNEDEIIEVDLQDLKVLTDDDEDEEDEITSALMLMEATMELLDVVLTNKKLSMTRSMRKKIEDHRLDLYEFCSEYVITLGEK